jgi:phosphate/phosphite/phosphonate ABC transporter binding protein
MRNPTPTMTTRHALFLSLALLTSGFAGRSAAAELKFGFTPVLGQSQTKAEFDPLMAYLAGAIGQKVSLYVAKDYGDLRTMMESGAVDIGSFSPFAYVDAARGGKVRIIAQSLLEGSGTYRGLIVVRKDSGLRTLADLAGKKFAYVDPKSASGYVYPRAMLLEKGIHPDTGFSEVIFAGDHNKVIAAVLGRRVDAGAIYDGAIRIAKNAGAQTEDLSVIASTDPIPHDAITVRSELDPILVQKIRAALVGMDKTDAGRLVIAASKKGLTGFVPAEDGLYDPVRRTAQTAGIR